MSARIPQSFIDEVLDRIDIVKMKTLVYLFIGISGAINVAEYFL